MISARMSRAVKVLLTVCAAPAIAALVAACGTQSIHGVSGADMQRGASLFNQRCSGCHTLSYAATHGSAANVRTKQYNNGPNFDQRCERPLTRVLYAIENGGFSGAIMPQNIVVGQDAIDVARFVATYGGRQTPQTPGVVPCNSEPIGNAPALTPGGTATAVTAAQKASRSIGQAGGPTAQGGKNSGQRKKSAPAKHP
jgi:mono/diheme cytochrome c family protein